MKILFKIVIFGLILNMSVLMLQAIFPQFNNIPEYRGGLDYQTNMNTQLDKFDTSVQSEGLIEKASSFLNSIFDIIGLGFLRQLAGFAKDTHSMIGILYPIFAPYMGIDLANAIFGAFSTVYSILTVTFMIYLITGRDLFNSWFGN